MPRGAGDNLALPLTRRCQESNVAGFQLCEGDGIAESLLQSCYGLDDRGIGCRFPGGIKDCLFSRTSRLVMGPAQPPT